MAAWEVSSAINSLRSLLGDNLRDKFEFKADVFPTPNGLATRFFVGQTRVDADSLQVYLAGVQAPSGGPSGVVALDAERGTFDLGIAPSGSVEVQASFFYQWFTDAELTVFLHTAAGIVGMEQADDEALPIGVRSAVLDFSAYYAYMKKAAEHADSLVATAAGYTADQSKSHPNWRDLAKTAMEQGKAKLELYVDSPLGRSVPQMRFVAFTLPKWQGP